MYIHILTCYYYYYDYYYYCYYCYYYYYYYDIIMYINIIIRLLCLLLFASVGVVVCICRVCKLHVQVPRPVCSLTFEFESFCGEHLVLMCDCARHGFSALALAGLFV